MVPVGLTQYRDGLYPLTSFTKQTCREAIRLVEAFAQTLPEPFAYLSDEFTCRRSCLRRRLRTIRILS